MPPKRLDYRPALDGLRAVAVLAVMLYHGQVGWLQGGFLGVDVFFVLSGFLITSLLLAEWRVWHSIDLRTFWVRRARRLLPALFLVLVAVGLYAAFAVSNDRLSKVRGDALATLLYVANWRFAVTGQSYFDQFHEPSPLLHMWSLGIEEQFYWLFPVLLLTWLHFRRSTRALPAVFLAGAAASALVMGALYRSGSDPSRVYYGTDTRAQALLVGAALAAWQVRRRSSGAVMPAALRRPLGLTFGRASDLIGLASLLGLLALFVNLHETNTWLYRGGFLVAAVLSAAVIAPTEDSRCLTARALAWEPLRRVGLISYGLYLWHWPVYLMLSPGRTGLSDLPLLAVRIVVTFGLASASYVLVESPIRRGVLRRRLRPQPRRLATASAVALTVGVVVAGTSGATAAPPVERTGTFETKIGHPSPGQISVLLAGDSPGRFLGWYFPSAEEPDLSLSTSTVIGCGLLPQTVVVDNVVTPSQPQCDEWPSEFRRASAAAHPDVVVLSTGAWEVFDHKIDGRVLRVGSEEYAAALERRYDTAIKALAGKTTPVALLNVPCFRQAPWTVAGVDMARDHNDPTRQEWLNSILQRVAAKYPGRVSVLDLRGLLCPSGHFVQTIDGVDVRPDGVHVGGPGGALVWRWLAPQLRLLSERRATKTAFLVGDSMALNLRANLPTGSPWRATGSSLLGCGLTPAAVSYHGEAKRLPPECVTWSRTWPEQLRAAKADVGLVMLGSQEQWDHVVDGRTLRFGTPAFERHLRVTLDRSIAPFVDLGLPVAVSTVPCHHVPDPGTIPDAKVINDQHRIAWLDGFAHRYGAERNVPIVELNRFLCPNGYRDQQDGVKLHEDGMHFTPEGAHLVWNWLYDQLVRVAATHHSSS